MERMLSNGTGAAGSNKTFLNVYASAASPITRKRFYEAIVGFGQAVADATQELYLGITTALGTPASTGTPRSADQGGSAGAGECTFGVGVYTGEPTYTSNKDMLWLPCHQRNTLRWIVSEGSEIVTAATQNTGLACRCSSSTGSATGRAQMAHKE